MICVCLSLTMPVQDVMAYMWQHCCAQVTSVSLQCNAVQYMGMQSQQTQMVSIQSVLTCTGQSVDQHKMANYYHAILSIILAQFSHRGFENGMAGTVRLAQASPYIRVRSLPHCILCFHSVFCLDVEASWHVDNIGVCHLLQTVMLLSGTE